MKKPLHLLKSSKLENYYKNLLCISKIIINIKKDLVLKNIIYLLVFISSSLHAQDFITTWQTTIANETITLPNSAPGVYNFNIDWGDGTIENNVNVTNHTHTYVIPGIYTVRINGLFPRFDFEAVPTSRLNLLSVEQWGAIAWSRLSFFEAPNFNINATDAPDLSNVTAFDNLFRNATTVNADLSGWNVSTITNMINTFSGATAFNGDISTWNTSNVLNMAFMFAGATSFNQDISGWNTSMVNTMDFMFASTSAFNQNIGGWNTSMVNNMGSMFRNSPVFNQDISGWNTGNVNNMSFMFFNTPSFNQDISGWNTGMVNNMTRMFNSATAFNQDISGWNTSMVNTMDFMFANATAFNQDIGGLDISGVLNMANMLDNSGISQANYDAILIGWAAQTVQSGVNLGANGLLYCIGETARNTLINAPNSWTITGDTNDCFTSAFITTWQTTVANETITLPNNGIPAEYNFTIDWDDSTIENNVTIPSHQHTYTTPGTYTVRISGQFERFDFENVPTNATNLLSVEQWGGLAVSSLSFMGASNFQINATDTPDLSNVTSFFNLFNGASAVNADLSGWDVSTITNMNQTFFDAVSFNGDVSTWNTSNVTTMNFMFDNAAVFNQDISGWNTSNVTDMRSMFLDALAFNQDIGGWNTSMVNDMRSMFNNAESFNQDISGWNTSLVNTMRFMFSRTDVFNQDISGWNTGNVNDMSLMFNEAMVFNQDISGWSTSMVNNMEFMFNNAAAFNQDIGGLDISSVTNMTSMLDNSGLSKSNYDDTLIGWAAQSVQSNVPLGAAGLTYCRGQNARNTLTNAPNSWTITGDALSCTTIQFNASTASDSESSGGNLPLLFINGSITVASTITVTNPGTGSATVVDDFTFTTPQVINIPIGVYDGTSATAISIPTLSIINDNNVENAETIDFTLGSPTGDPELILGTNTTHTYTINDDDLTGLTISIGSPVNATEVPLPATTNASFTVSLDGGVTNNTGSAITGTIALTGTATNGADYTNVTAFSIPNTASSVVVNVPIIDDTEVEITETIIATISAPSIGAINGTNDSATANINDNDADPTNVNTTITATSPVVANGTDTSTVTVQLANANGNLLTASGGTVVLVSTGSAIISAVTDNLDGTYTATVTNTTAETVTINGTLDGTVITDTADIIFTEAPALSNLALSKIGTYEDFNNDDLLNVGDRIIYSFTIENNGNQNITNIIISDPLPGIILNGGPIDLAPGEIDSSTFTASYELTENDIITGAVVNQAFATGQNPSGIDVLDFSDDPTNNTNTDDDDDGDGEDETITELLNEDEFIIYEVITPNGDGLNDEFRVSGLNKFPNNTMTIYNRWGAKVFKANGYEQPGTPLFKGISKGKEKTLPTGTYYFTLEYQNSVGLVELKSGYLYIN